MATIGQRRCKVYGTVNGNSPQRLSFIQGTSETFKKGALLYLTASQTVRVFSVDTTSADFYTNRLRIIGIADADADNYTTTTAADTGKKMPVWTANSNTIFISNAISRTSAATSTLAYTDRGKQFGASVNGSMMYVDLGSSVGASIGVIIQLIDSPGDKYGRVLWQLHPRSYALGV